MSDYQIHEAALWGYGFAALVFAAFALRLSLTWRGGMRAGVIFFAAVTSAFWAVCIIFALAFDLPWLWSVARVFDALRLAAWMGFVLLLLEGWDSGKTVTGKRFSEPWLVILPVTLLLVGALLPAPLPWNPVPVGSIAVGAYVAELSAAVLGLAFVEQLFRRTPEHGRWAIKPLTIGLGGMFALDILMYSDGMLFQHLDPTLWAARGVAHALVVFFVILATARNASWTIDMHVSRGVVFHSTAILIAGIYLLVVTAAGYWVRIFGGSWGGTMQVAFVFAALLLLASLVLSGSLRGRLRVFISKHFFSYRYDYRSEWLQFTHVLGTPEQGENLYERVVRALANLVESLGGGIWLERGGEFHQVARSTLPEVKEAEPASGAFAGYLARTGWVIRLDEFAASPERYPELALPQWFSAIQKSAWLVVPLPGASELIGFVILARPRTPVDVNWEVRDLLKTASRQAASYLAQIRASEALLEAEKFDAFNRMSAFVVHDLKNLVAQLGLMLKNAERHRDNPEFQRDMLETVENVHERMNRLMLQLRTGTTPAEKPRPVDLRRIVDSIAKSKQQNRVPIDVTIDVEWAPESRALAHEDRIERVIGHIVQNAIEATGERGSSVRVGVRVEGKFAVIEVVDEGIGMSSEFVRERLFKPFQTTKSAGMGIGMNESYQYINGIGGRIDVESTQQQGTRFRVFLPIAENAALPAEAARRIA